MSFEYEPEARYVMHTSMGATIQSPGSWSYVGSHNPEINFNQGCNRSTAQ